MHRATGRGGRLGDRADGGVVGRLERGVLRVLDDGWRRVADKAGDWLACRPGCAACCHGPFPITRLDEVRLRRGLERVRAERPSRAARIVGRARRALDALEPGFPGDPSTGRLVRDEAALDRLFERHAAMPCPALDPRSGRCELYAARPVACRHYGPPLRFGGELAPPCRLCFRGADPAAVEACRFEPDPAGLEQALLDRLGVGPGEEWETLIAFALGLAFGDARRGHQR